MRQHTRTGDAENKKIADDGLASCLDLPLPAFIAETSKVTVML